MQKASEKGKQEAAAEAKAAKQEARKMRSMKQESIASALSLPATLSSLGSVREDILAGTASGSGKIPHQAFAAMSAPNGTPARSQLGATDTTSEDKGGTHSGSTRSPGRGGKNQRFAPDAIAGLASVPESSPGATVPDVTCSAANAPAAQHEDGPAHAAAACDPGVLPGGPPTGNTGSKTHASPPHVKLDDVAVSPAASVASMHTAGPTSAGTSVTMQQGVDSTSGVAKPGTAPGAAGTNESPETQQDTPSAARPRASGLFGKFKAKATELVQEHRLGNVKRFASKALVDTMAKVEQCVLLQVYVVLLRATAVAVWSSSVCGQACGRSVEAPDINPASCARGTGPGRH